MRKAHSTVIFTSDRETIWSIITDISDYAWRSDWRKVEGSEDPNQFTVYAKDGNNSTFTIIKKEPYSLYEFTMDNAYLTGHWTGRLEMLPDGRTQMDISETLKLKNLILGFLSYLFLNMQKSQAIYVRDLRKKLKEDTEET